MSPAAVEKSRVPQLAEDLIHTLHLDEVLLIPARTWGSVVNLIAYELAEDESWLSVDAEASLHQNGRDPLQLGPPDLSLVTAMCEALMKHGENEDADLCIVALVKGAERYAANKELSFTWYDAAVLSGKIRENAEAVE